MGRSLNATAASGALTVQAFVGDGCTLLAFDLKQGATENFAGFAIKRQSAGRPGVYIDNMLSFDARLTQDSAETDVHQAATPSNVAPFQKFRWIDFPDDVNSGDFQYQVETKYFDPDQHHLKTVDTVVLTVTLGSRQGANFHVGFTRGYLSSQAYARKFNNAPFRPDSKDTYLFDSSPYEAQWAWLGYHARIMLFGFLSAAMQPDVASVDAFIYDVDEPDFVRDLEKIAKTKTLRIILDDSEENGKPKPDRAACEAALEPIIGKDNILRTHFKRFAHDKVLILRDHTGNATQVLCGSANFSIRGLYVQGNSVIIIDDTEVAGTYAQAFDEAWKVSGSASAFAASPVATQLFTFDTNTTLPDFALTFAPHKDGNYALGMVANAIGRAQKDVIFALMSDGGGAAIEALTTLATKEQVFSFGILQTDGLAQKLVQGDSTSSDPAVENEIASFTPLDTIVPAPFAAEISGGMGQVIHHKFVVVDFNGTNPVVFCGSSNLSSGGEAANGDNLLAIYDREVATLYAIEGIRLADHYRFRDKLSTATDASPMCLQGPQPAAGAPFWYADYFTAGTAKYRSRIALIQ